MEQFIYVNGEFWMQTNKTIEEIIDMAFHSGAYIERIEPYDSAVYGKCENVYLSLGV